MARGASRVPTVTAMPNSQHDHATFGDDTAHATPNHRYLEFTERQQMKLLPSLLLSGAIIGALAAPAASASGVKLGMLDCVVEDGASLMLATSRSLQCKFTPSIPGHAGETYTGTIDKYGLDLGLTQNTLIRWAVVAPTKSAYSEGALAGRYGGASASASVIVGVGTNVLVGGLEQSIALQPVSVQSQEGINLAVGVTALKLAAD